MKHFFFFVISLCIFLFLYFLYFTLYPVFMKYSFIFYGELGPRKLSIFFTLFQSYLLIMISLMFNVVVSYFAPNYYLTNTYTELFLITCCIIFLFFFPHFFSFFIFSITLRYWVGYGVF